MGRNIFFLLKTASSTNRLWEPLHYSIIFFNMLSGILLLYNRLLSDFSSRLLALLLFYLRNLFSMKNFIQKYKAEELPPRNIYIRKQKSDKFLR